MRRFQTRFFLSIATAVLATLTLGAKTFDGPTDYAEKPAVAGDLTLLYRSDFADDGLKGWAFTDQDAWRIGEQDGVQVLEQFQASKYEPEYRSPFNMAILDDLVVDEFVLDLQVRSTARDYGHRDICLFFGHVDPSHFQYVHLGKEADEHAHSIFAVDASPRVSVAEERTAGTPWTDGWHHVRLVRNPEKKSTLVYFDDMETPIMQASDGRFPEGRVGLGTFDDTAQFAAIQVWGRKVEGVKKSD